MEQTWRHGSSTGTVGLIHPETHFTDEKAGNLREATYLRLRRHWQFVNELKLFEIDHHVALWRARVRFKQASPSFKWLLRSIIPILLFARRTTTARVSSQA